MVTRTTRVPETGGHEPRAVQKALALLEAVAQIGSGARAKDVANFTGIAPATAYRLLNLLVADGYLVRIEDLSGFALGRRTRELAGAAPQTAVVDHRQIIDEIRSHTRFGVYLVSYQHDRIALIDRDPDHELPGESALATHPHASAIGKLLLANRPDGVSLKDLRKFTSRTITDLADLAVELSRIRSCGIAIEVDEIKVGRSAIAVPIRDDADGVRGALAVIGRTGRLHTDDAGLIELLTASAREIGTAR
ncbi:IclR family transcriptional regulator [Rhodococcus sp. 1168]|uniref:IclR family transcriptional regulator n=1 Tax=Rhodococcus sp. 1168 TaxID=2018041 RepID=UPI000A0DCBBA|nr:IclR family transcriptional regulator C-terminal domain-containing protein [Rhodococcus sp. 1168]ORI16498.1 IclR family transcriptional regulator [Rhodococcus sp. 1168]